MRAADRLGDRPLAVLFDLDDTLFDHWACTRTALQSVREQFPVLSAWSLDELERRHAVLLEALHLDVLAGRLTVDDARRSRFGRLAAEAGGRENDAPGAEIAAAYRDAYVSFWRPVPGARALLETLHSQVRVGIVTNNVASEQRQKIAACGFEGVIDAVAISEEVGIAKPDPRIFADCLARLGVGPERSVMVGDSWPSDIVGARSAGLVAIWFNRPGAPVPDGSDVVQLRSLEPVDAAVRTILRGARREAD